MLDSANRSFFFFSSLWKALVLAAACAVVVQAEPGVHAPGRLLVGPKKEAVRRDISRTLLAHRAAVRREIPQIGASVLEVPEEASTAILQSLRSTGLFEYVERDYYAHTGALPNDPYYPQQCHLPRIQAPAAWEVNAGLSSVVVAVIDSGVDPFHPDLASKLVPGWSFIKNSTDTSDVLGHGTPVAGTLAAASHNGIGVAGVSWGGAIMPLAVVNAHDVATYSDIAAAIQYAADRGVRIINVSAGGTSPSAALQSAVNYAWSKGAVVFAAAMNAGSETPYYPAACDRVVAVSATDSSDALASFSSFGESITLSAPGASILAPTLGGGYGFWYGTSFASPIAAGVAALALSVNPSLTNTELIALLKQNADDLGAPGFDKEFGWGRVNAYRTVTAATPPPVISISIQPASAVLRAGENRQFTATVSGSSTGVAWRVDPAVGTVSGAGLYTAPAVVASIQTLTVTAVSLERPTTSASATLTLQPATGDSAPPIPASLDNIALGKATAQSSTYGTGPAAALAVDGNTNGSYWAGSVTHTNADANAWWQVDLGASAIINSIAVWNRTDCCSERLGDYWIFVSDAPFAPTDTPATLQSRPGVWSSRQTSAPTPSTTIAAGGITGRYVRLQLAGANHLSLAEVQVMGALITPPASNIALGKATAQSSTYGTGPAAALAVDGNTNGSYWAGSVTHTNADANAWWQVDLGASAIINSIVVWNRTDCCSDRLGDYWIFISDTPFAPTDTPATLQSRPGVWSNRQTSAPAPSTTIAAGAITGRYIRLQLAGANHLSLAEVQVMGALIAPPASNIAQGKAAAQSSTYGTGPAAALAVDGNTNGSYWAGSVTHTNADANAWWQVDLGASAIINSIVVWNRTDCCSDRLADYWVFVSDSPFGAFDTPATLLNRPGTWASRQTTIPSPSAQISTGGITGRYIRVQRAGGDYLSLAEVQVF